MNILVTGHLGFFGKALTKKLKQKGNFVVGIDNKECINQNSHELNVSIKGDVRDINLLRRLIVDYEIEEIYHFAAQSITKICSTDPYDAFETNLMGTVSLLEACRNWGSNVKKIIISTSDKVYGNASVPYTEESPLKPVFIYDTSKACQQHIAIAYYKNYGIPIRIVTSSNVYGPSDFNMSRVVPKTIIRLALGKPAILWKDSAEFIREFVYIDDVIDAFIAVAEKGKNGEVYCCGETEHLKIRDLIIKICNLMGKYSYENIMILDRPIYLMEIEKQYQKATKLCSLGWFPKVSLEEGLKKTIEFYKKMDPQFSGVAHLDDDVQKTIKRGV